VVTAASTARPPIIVRQGDDYLFAWPDDGIQFRVSNVRDAHDALKCELTLESLREGERGVLAWEELNLKVGRSRAELGNRLKEFDEQIAWRLRLDALAIKVAELHRAGSPSVDLADVTYRAEVPYLLPLLLPDGETTVLFGDGSSGKSMFSQCLALSVATGRAIPGLEPPSRTGKVLALDYETRPETWARRIHRLAAALGVEPLPRGLVVYKAMLRPLAWQVADLRREVAEGNYALVILDSLVPACDGNPADAQVAAAVMNGMRSLETTSLIVGHITKEAALNGKKIPATIFGSQFFRNLARNSWYLTADEESVGPDRRATLEHKKANEDEQFRGRLRVTYGFSPGGPIAVSVGGAPLLDDGNGSTLRQRILTALAAGLDVPTRIAGHVYGRDVSREEVDTIGAKLRQMAGHEVLRVETLAPSTGRGNEQRWELKANVRVSKGERSPLGAGLGSEKANGVHDRSAFRSPLGSPPLSRTLTPPTGGAAANPNVRVSADEQRATGALRAPKDEEDDGRWNDDPF